MRVEIGALKFTAPSGLFTRKKDRYQFTQKVFGTRRVTVDYAKGVISISLAGVEMGAVEGGNGPVPFSLEVDDMRFADAPQMTGSTKALKY